MDVSKDQREFLRHTVATLAYRGGKAVRDAPAGFESFRLSDSARTPAQILAHIGDLLAWFVSMAGGTRQWHDSKPLPWKEEVARFFAQLAEVERFLASDAAMQTSAEKLFQGPVADALTHVGQLTMLRRAHGVPIRAENYLKADIEAGRVGEEQAKPKFEFD